MTIYKIELSRAEKHSLYAASGFIIVGYLLAIGVSDPEIFQRFGSLVVCIGVIFSIKGIPQLLDATKMVFDKQTEDLRREIESAADGHPLEKGMRAAMEEDFEPILTEREQQFSRLLFSVKRRLLRIEGGIVVVGTFIWGFGDFLVPGIGPLFAAP